MDLAKKTLSILIADDSPSIRAYLKAILKNQHIVADEASDGIEANRMIQSKVYDVVFMDINMPRKSGLEVIKRVRGKLGYKYTPIIVMTELKRSDLIKEAFECGASDYIAKPLNEIEVLSRMQMRIENHELNRELYHARQKEEKANQAKSQFLANMSHELRTPMHAISNFSRLALKRVDDEKVTRFLNNIIASTDRLTGLINALLDLSKLEAGKTDVHFQQGNLVDTIHQCIDELQSLVDAKSIKLEFDDENEMPCEYDHNLISQVIINLLSNAIKFSPENGLIKLSLHHEQLEKDAKFSGGIEISISDEGLGIPEEELETVFDKFMQSSKTDSSSGGTGLGLPICREIINLHNGHIWCESPSEGRDNGCTFHFVIPKYQTQH